MLVSHFNEGSLKGILNSLVCPFHSPVGCLVVWRTEGHFHAELLLKGPPEVGCEGLAVVSDDLTRLAEPLDPTSNEGFGTGLGAGGGERERRLFKHSSGHFSPLQHCSGLGENWPLVNLIFFPRSHFQVLQTAASSSSMKEGVAHVAHFTFLRFLLTIAKLLLLLALLLTNTNLSRGR